MPLVILLQPVTQTVQILVEAETQRPKAANGLGRTQLILIAAHQLLKICKERFHGPAFRHCFDHLLQGIVQTSGDVETGLFHRRIGRGPDDQHLADAKFLNAGLDEVRPDPLFSFLAGPQHRFEGFGTQPGGELIQSQPHPLARPWIQHPQLMIGLQPASEIPAPPFDRLPHGFVDVPTIDQHVRVGVWHRLKAFHRLESHVDLALENSLFLFADRFLDVHLRIERVLAVFEQVDPLKQAVSGHTALISAGVMPALPAHHLGVALDVGRVIQDQVTGHQGCRGTTPFFRPLQALAFVGGCNKGLNFSPEYAIADFGQSRGRPAWTDQETAQIPNSHQDCNSPQHSGERTRSLTMDQAHQYGLKVHPLGWSNDFLKVHQVVAEAAFLDDNGEGHVFLLISDVGTPNVSEKTWPLDMILLNVQNYCYVFIFNSMSFFLS
jgi:hypothetical protein